MTSTHPEQSIEQYPIPETSFAWARKVAQEGDWSESAKRWAVLRQAYPNHPATWFGAINAHIEAGEIEKAIVAMGSASEKFPNHPNILLQGAKIKLQQNQPDTAAELLTIARQKHAGKLETWLQSADCAAQKGRFDEAEQFNTEARQRFPDALQAHKQCSELAMQQKNWELALERWESFRKQFPEHPAGYLLAAEAAEQSGNPKLARKLKLANEYGDDLLTEMEEEVFQSQTNQRHRHTTLGGLTELVWTKAIFNLRSETQRNYLSYLWWILEPLLYMVVYFLVFGVLLQRGGEGFITFLLTGLIPWTWFSKAVSSSSNSIIAGQGLMLQVGIPSIVFPLVSLLQASLKQIPVFLVLFAFVWLQGYPPDVHWLALFPVVLIQVMLTIMFGCLLAALVPFVRDVSHLVPTGLMFVMFLSGIFYSYERIPAQWQNIFLMNPIAFILKCYREIFIDGIYPDFVTLGTWGIISMLGCVLILMAYKKLRYIFPRVVLA